MHRRYRLARSIENAWQRTADNLLEAEQYTDARGQGELGYFIDPVATGWAISEHHEANGVSEHVYMPQNDFCIDFLVRST